MKPVRRRESRVRADVVSSGVELRDPPANTRTSSSSTAATIPDLDLDVRRVLEHAMSTGMSVMAVLRGDAATGKATRTVEGIPTGFRPTRDGRARVVFETPGGSDQLVL